jgi:hypothetical protein
MVMGRRLETTMRWLFSPKFMSVKLGSEAKGEEIEGDITM